MKINKKLKSLRRFRNKQGSLEYGILRKLSGGRLKRQLLIRTDPKLFNHSARRINRMMSHREFSYLEIGVAHGTTLQSVNSKRLISSVKDCLNLHNFSSLTVDCSSSESNVINFYQSIGFNLIFRSKDTTVLRLSIKRKFESK